MRVWVFSVLGLGVLGLSPDGAYGQGLAGTVHLGTSGLGGRAAFPLSGQVNLRGGLDFQPFRFEFDDEDIAYVLELPSPRNTLNKSVPGTLDLRGGSSRAERDDRGGGRWSR